MKNLIFLAIFAVLVSNIFVSANNSFLSLVNKKVQDCPAGTSLCGDTDCCKPGKCCSIHVRDFHYCCPGE